MFLLLQFLLELRQLAVFQLCRLIQVIFSFCRFDFGIDIFNFLSQLLHNADGILFILPFCLQSREVFTHFSQFLLDFLQMLLRQLIVLFFQCRFFDFMLNDFSLDYIQLGRHGVHFGTNHRARFIHQVNRFIGQKSIRNVSVGQGCRRNDCLILNFYAMINLISFLQTTQNSDGILNRRLIDHNRLEPTFQSRVFFHILSVFIQCSCTDTMQLTSCQHRLQQVACIHCAVRFACTNNRMQLINKEDNLTFALSNLIQNGFQSLLKFTTEFCACNQRTHIQREDGFILQAVGYILFHDTLCQTFCNGGFADTGFTNQNRVVFRLSGQNTDDVSDFIVTPNHRIKLFASCLFHQVCAVFLQSIIGCFGRIARHSGVATDGCQNFHKSVSVHVVLTEQLLQSGIGCIDHCHKDMLYGNIFVRHIFCQLFCRGQCFFQINRNSCFAAADTRQPFYLILHCLRQAVDIDIHLLQQSRNQAILLLEQSQQQMLLIQLRIPIFNCIRLGVLNGLQRFLCKFL